MAVIEEIKKLLSTKKLVIGSDETLKCMRTASLQKVFLASNVKEDLRSDIEHLAAVHGIELVEVGIPNDELGVSCKKPFSISVIGLKKQ